MTPERLTDPTLALADRRPTWAEIDLGNLVHNFSVMRGAIGPGVAIMAAVKADAYGHGARMCAVALERAGADWFGVALPEEGVALRQAGVTRPILCLGGFWQGQEARIIDFGLTPTVFRLDLLERLDAAARERGQSVAYHLKVDTGMGRLGVPFSELEGFLDKAKEFEHASLDGVMTHFAAADDPDQTEFTKQQMALFARAVERVGERGFTPRFIHQANSAAAHAHPSARGNLVRLGGVIYGVWRDATNPAVEPLDWRPALALRTRVGLLKNVPEGTPLGYGRTFVTSRPSLIATIPIGYEDGLSRALSNRGRVIVGGRFAPIVGRISMDLTIVDVTDVEGVETGDLVTIIGNQDGLEITAEDVAAELGTISYEVTCRVSDRVPRVYLEPS
ncbi:MAG TPA: alanine racemase [Blastocatellia bacterium]|nr:alanine racemase [Blastocatellia bacterium]